jgi:tRNA threonylcarbamoyladenosine biosynthesis protein TsaB
MMFALALDTSGTSGSVALVREDDNGLRELLGHEIVDRGMRRGVDLFPAVRRVLGAAGIAPRDVPLVAVGTGPGSYTGLRVGITAARACAYAAGCRLLGVRSCDAWAAAVPVVDRPHAVVLDAKVKAVYLAQYERRTSADHSLWVPTGEPVLLDAPEAAAQIAPDALVVGDARAAYAPHFDPFDDAPGPAPGPARADARRIAELALERHRRGEQDSIEDVLPLYLERRAPGARNSHHDV